MGMKGAPLGRILDRLFDRRLDEIRGAGRILVRVPRTVYLAAREFRLDFCWERAATLAFSTVLSLLPLAVLFMSILTLRDGSSRAAPPAVTSLAGANDRAGSASPPRPALGESPEAGPGGGPDDGSTGAIQDPSGGSTDEAAGVRPLGDRNEVKEFVLETVLEYLTTKELKDDAREVIEKHLRTEVFQPGVLPSLLAFFGLLIAGLALLVSSERVFCRIWKTRSTRTYLQKFVAFWMILTTSPLLVSLSFYVHHLSTDPASNLAFVMEKYAFVKTMYGVFIPVAVSCTAFFLMYVFLPVARVRLLPALAGGLVAGVLWEGLKAAFLIYVREASTLSSFYGPLGMVPFFLVFIYVTWVVILWGGEIAYAGQNYPRLVHDFRLRRHREVTLPYSASFLGLQLLGRMVGAHGGRRPPTSVADLAADIDAYPEDYQAVVDRLLADGVIVENAAEPGTYVLAAAADAMPLRPVVEALLAIDKREELDLPEVLSDQGRAGAFHRAGREAYLAAFDSLTLAALEEKKSPADSASDPDAAGPVEERSTGQLVGGNG